MIFEHLFFMESQVLLLRTFAIESKVLGLIGYQVLCVENVCVCVQLVSHLEASFVAMPSLVFVVAILESFLIKPIGTCRTVTS